MLAAVEANAARCMGTVLRYPDELLDGKAMQQARKRCKAGSGKKCIVSVRPTVPGLARLAAAESLSLLERVSAVRRAAATRVFVFQHTTESVDIWGINS